MTTGRSAGEGPSRADTWVFGVGVVAGLAGTAWFGYLTIFSVFSWWDDEGFLMLSYAMFNRGHALYDQIFSLYGPFPYLYHRVASLSLPVSHDLTRLLTLAHWVLAAALSGWLVLRLTRSSVLSLLVVFECGVLLTELVHEPGHPQGLCLLLILAAVHLAIPARGASDGGRRNLWFRAFGVGCCVGLLALTKINLGLFLAVAVAAALLAVPRGGLEKAAQAAVHTGAVAVPFVLMRVHLHRPWALAYASLVGVSVAALVAATARRGVGPPSPRRQLAAVGIGGLVAVVGTSVLILFHGTTPAGLLRGWLFRIVAFGEVFDLPAPFGVVAVAVAVASCGVAVAHRLAVSGRLGPRGAEVLYRAVTGLKVALLAGVLYSVHRDSSVLLAFAAPWIWLVTVHTVRTDERPGRLLLAWMTVMLLLWAYPVYGSQSSWSVLLLLPTMAVAGHDALERLVRVRRRATVLLARAAVPVLLFAYLGIGPLGIAAAVRTYVDQHPLPFPGAERIRLPADAASKYIRLVGFLRRESDTFLTMPGLGSLYFWSGRQPPTGLNATAWMSLLTDAEQEEIIAAVAGRERVLAVVNPVITRFWIGSGQVRDGPLVRYLRERFRPVARFGEFEVRAPAATNGRPAPAWGVRTLPGARCEGAEWRKRARSSLPVPDSPRMSTLTPLAATRTASACEDACASTSSTFSPNRKSPPPPPSPPSPPSTATSTDRACSTSARTVPTA